MTAEQQAQIDGFRVHLDVAGTLFTAGTRSFYALAEDAAMLAEPFETARAKTPIYATVTALTQDVTSPREIAAMQAADGRTYRVIELKPMQDNAFLQWFCEVQRT